MNHLNVLTKKEGHLMKYRIPPPHGHYWPPINYRYQDGDDTFFVLKAANDDGYFPLPTVFRPVKLPPFVSNPLTFISVEHDFLLGNNRLILAPPNGYGFTSYHELVLESAHHAALAQPPPVVNLWNNNGTWAAVPGAPHVPATPPASPSPSGDETEPMNEDEQEEDASENGQEDGDTVDEDWSVESSDEEDGVKEDEPSAAVPPANAAVKEDSDAASH